MEVQEAKGIIKKFEEGDKALFNWSEDYKRFVDNNIYYCVSSEWEYMINKSFVDPDSPCSYEGIDLLYFDEEDFKRDILNEFESIKEDTDSYNLLIRELEEMTDFKDEMSFFKDWLETLEEEELKEVINISYFNHLEIEDYEREKEIYEWWLVSVRLKNLMPNEVFVNGAWGRQTTGQRISMDYCIMKAYIKSLKDYIRLVE